MTRAEQMARDLISKRTTEQIVREFELTDYLDVCIETANVRGWYMDELEKRDAEAFDKWIDSDEDSPRKFFIKEN